VFFDQVRERQGRRIQSDRGRGMSPDIYEFIREDLLGPRVTADFFRNSAAYKELQTLEGLKPVKESVEQLIKFMVSNADREEQEKPLQEVNSPPLAVSFLLAMAATFPPRTATYYAVLLLKVNSNKTVSVGRRLLRRERATVRSFASNSSDIPLLWDLRSSC
jgi:hypothetical protein